MHTYIFYIYACSVGGSLPIIFSYAAEFIRNKYRGPYLAMVGAFWMVGQLLCGAVAWIILPEHSINGHLGTLTFHGWRLFIAISALPAIIGAILYIFMPESPRYHLEVLLFRHLAVQQRSSLLLIFYMPQVGKEEKALKTLEFAYRWNHLRKWGEPFPVHIHHFHACMIMYNQINVWPLLHNTYTLLYFMSRSRVLSWG